MRDLATDQTQTYLPADLKTLRMSDFIRQGFVLTTENFVPLMT